MRLARFAGFDEEFIRARFLEACLNPRQTSPLGTRNETILVALASWINLPSEQTSGLPLVQRQLVNVTADLCRSLHVGPMAFADLAASEVEMLWQNLDHETDEDEVRSFPVRSRPMRAPAPAVS